MKFDFQQEYKTYSNIDLLKIVKRPGNYQPEAVAVAEQILRERNITAEEILLVDEYFNDLESNVNAKQERANALKDKATDFFEPVLRPGDQVEPNKWVNLLLLVMGLQYAWTLFGTAREFIELLQCNYCSWDMFIIAELLTLVYVPIVFYLVLKRKRWGWILLFADNLFIIISRLSQSYIFFKYQDMHHGNTASFILPILIRSAFAFFLWRDQIATHFGVDQKTKKNTAIITATGTVVLLCIMYLLIKLN